LLYTPTTINSFRFIDVTEKGDKQYNQSEMNENAIVWTADQLVSGMNTAAGYSN